MYNKIRVYEEGWSKIYHGSQTINTISNSEYTIEKYKEDRFEIFKNGCLVADVFHKNIKLDGEALEFTPSKKMVSRGWVLPEGGKIEMNISGRYFTINDSDEIWIYKGGGMFDCLMSIILDRRFGTMDKYFDVYFSSEINPVYVICALLVAKFRVFHP